MNFLEKVMFILINWIVMFNYVFFFSLSFDGLEIFVITTRINMLYCIYMFIFVMGRFMVGNLKTIYHSFHNSN